MPQASVPTSSLKPSEFAQALRDVVRSTPEVTDAPEFRAMVTAASDDQLQAYARLVTRKAAGGASLAERTRLVHLREKYRREMA